MRSGGETLEFVIHGGTPLSGSVRVHGAKNAALPILAASVLASGEYVLHDFPQLTDIATMLQILESLGIRNKQEGRHVILDTRSLSSSVVPESLMSQMRSSIFLMGPLLARFGEVTVSRPGGCAIGERRIDLHLDGLERMGAEIRQQNGRLVCRAPRLYGTTIYLDYPSVGATENLMMAAVLAEGETVIHHAAKEPEIVDLQNFLNAMGARIRGAGTDTIFIQGVKKLRTAEYTVMPDRIVAGTLMVAGAMTCGEVVLENVIPDHVRILIELLQQAGCQVREGNDALYVKGAGRPKAIKKVTTSPFPGFPTDMQAQMMAFLSIADGVSILKETVFDARFRHVNELNRMGASIYVDLNTAFIRGVKQLTGAVVEASDLRAGAALVLAGLVAEGVTRVQQIHHIDRGYERIEEMLQPLGAKISRKMVD